VNKIFNIHSKKVYFSATTKPRLSFKRLNLPLRLRLLYSAVRFTNVYSEKLPIAFANIRV